MTPSTPAYCPACGAAAEPPTEGAVRCPTHDLFLIAASEAAHLDDHPLLGHVLDEKYALTSVVGAGGFGAVFGGLQLPLRRPVAVKLLLGASFAQKVARERFEREALSLARLRSEHTVRLLDFGVCRDASPATRNLPYLVMELIDGVPLNEFHARTPLSLPQMADLADEVAESLAEAHARGIVHRDLKPSNILLTRDFQGRTLAKVIDFGIARVEDAARSEAGLVSGTPRYMAPEQARSVADLDGRVDVYALGVILYELIVGRVPFSHALPMVLLQMQVVDEVPSFTAQGVPPGLDAVEAVIRRALSKAPAERFETPLALAAAFRAAVASLNTATPRPSSDEDPAALLHATTLAPPPLTPAFPGVSPASVPVVLPGAAETPPPLSSERPAPAPSRLGKSLLAVAVLAAGVFLVLRLTAPDDDGAPIPPAARTVATPAAVGAAPGPPTFSPPASSPPERAALPAAPPAPVSLAAASGPPTAAVAAAVAAVPGPPSRPRPAVAKPAGPDAEARALAQTADAALDGCRCAAADAAIRALADRPGADALVSGLRTRLATCRNIDPDHRCVEGRLEEVE